MAESTQSMWRPIIRSSYCGSRSRGKQGPQDKVITFHTDCSLRTMHVALNDESEYSGGRPVFATASGFEQPPRPVGSAVIHSDRVAHGVTAMRHGVRYSLFLCDSRKRSEE